MVCAVSDIMHRALIAIYATLHSLSLSLCAYTNNLSTRHGQRIKEILFGDIAFRERKEVTLPITAHAVPGGSL